MSGKNIITKFERAKVLSTRAIQISSGAPPLVQVLEYEIDALDIAERELEQGKMPITILRLLPDGTEKRINLFDDIEYKSGPAGEMIIKHVHEDVDLEETPEDEDDPIFSDIVSK